MHASISTRLTVVALFLAAGIGCGGSTENTTGSESNENRSFIAPFDGQSSIPVDLPLIVRAGSLLLPPDYPIPSDAIRVVDLANGGFVPGETIRRGEEISFVPDAPWTPDQRYSWTVDTVQPQPHGPEFAFPDNLIGTAVFDTSDDLALLAASLDPNEGEVCMVFSRPVTASDEDVVAFTANDIPLEDIFLRELPSAAWGEPYDLAIGDAGPGVACIVSPEPLGAGINLRFWWNDLGPFQATVVEGPIGEAMTSLRRGNW